MESPGLRLVSCQVNSLGSRQRLANEIALSHKGIWSLKCQNCCLCTTKKTFNSHEILFLVRGLGREYVDKLCVCVCVCMCMCFCLRWPRKINVNQKAVQMNIVMWLGFLFSKSEAIVLKIFNDECNALWGKREWVVWWLVLYIGNITATRNVLHVCNLLCTTKRT